MTVRLDSAFRSAARIKRDGSWSLAALILACIGVAACGKSPQPDAAPEQGHDQAVSAPAPIDASNLSALLKRCDVGGLTSALKDVLGLPSSTDVLTFLADAWGRGDADPQIVACMKKDLVRVYVANALAQGQSNRMIDVAELPAVLDALRTSLNSPNQEVVQVGMMGLGDFLTDDDVRHLGELAEGENQASSRVAVSTLALSCRPAAGAELKRLADHGGARLRDDVGVTRERVKDARTVKCGSTSG